MLNKKFLLGTVLVVALCLSACANGETEVTETSAATASESVSAAEKATVTETETEMQETEEVTETTAEDKKVSAEEYFSSRGFAFSERYKRSYEIILDMNDYKDVPNPFEDMDENYLKKIKYFTLLNVDGCGIDFISQLWAYEITVKDYSGSADFSGITCHITFDNYIGGDLSTVICSEYPYSIKFENYSGEYPLNGLPKNDVHYFDFENFADGVDFSFISEYPNAAYIRLKGSNTKDIDFNFIKDCKSLKSVLICGKSIDAEALAEILKNSNIGGLSVTVEDYSSTDAELLMCAAPSCSISYELDSSPWDYNKEPTEGVAFFANLYVYPNAEKKQWECETSSARAYYPGTWGYHGSLVCTFTNFTEEKQKINSVKIFRDDKGVLTEMPFADGSTSLEIDFAAEPNANSDFDITEEMFPFSKCETGIYKVVFDWNGERLEQQFAICNSDEDFLTEEQNEIFQKAYKITDRYFGCSTYLPQEYIDDHTTEEFLVNLYEGYTRDYAYSKSVGKYIDKDGNLMPAYGDRGGDISEQGNFFMPIYSNENEVLFKNFVIHGHEDYPYYIWFEEINYHMVKTDEGWRFDQFDLWY